MEIDDKKGLPLLEAELKKGKRQLTIGDAASVTAMDFNNAKRALEELLGKYESRMQVTENGDLIYDFGQSLKRRGKKSFKEIWGSVKKWSWKAFKAFFKVWITITLVVYFTLFLLILIGLIVAAMSSKDDSSSDNRGGGFGGMLRFYLIFDLFQSLFYYRTITGRTVVRYDQYGYPYRAYEPRQAKDENGNAKGKNFVAAVYDFVFGPPRIEQHPLENYQEVATFLKQQKGVIVKSEVVGLAGWKSDEADNFFTDVMVRFDGEAHITDNATLYADFQELIRRKTDTTDEHPVTWYWDEFEAPYTLTGNSKGKNWLIGSMNTFNFLFAGFFLFGGHYEAVQGVSMEVLNTLQIVLGYIPFIFSLIFFSVPLVRYYQNKKKEEARHISNIRKRLMRAIFMAKNGKITDNALVEEVNQANSKAEKLTSDKIKSVMNDLIFDLGGDMSVNEAGELEYHFEDLQRELATVAEIRRKRQSSGTDLGDVVFDTSSID